jgi:hypothetical protein
MAKKKSVPNAANLMVNLFDGTRKQVASSFKVLITIINGNQQQWYRNYRTGPSHYFQDLPVFDNFGDNYTVVVWAKGYLQAGFTPIKISRGTCQHIDLMLLPVDGDFNFNGATWDALKTNNKTLSDLLRSGTKSENAAKERYDSLREAQPQTIAAFLNITTAMRQICLPERTPLDYFKELIWEEMKQDRFFAYADPELLKQVERAAAQGKWAPEVGSAVFHEGATKSYKQIQFGEANVQLTFHEGDTKQIGGLDCIKVEPDMDYYKDLAAHALLEVLPNTISGQKSDPKAIYVLRWIAGRQAGLPEFDPPYTIV